MQLEDGALIGFCNRSLTQDWRIGLHTTLIQSGEIGYSAIPIILQYKQGFLKTYKV